MFTSSVQRCIKKFHDKVDHAAGVEITPVYLSISGNLRKWQVKNNWCLLLATGKKILSYSEFIDLKNIFIHFPPAVVLTSAVPRSGVLRSHMVVTRLCSIKARWCNLCSARDKDSKCHVTSIFLPRFFAEQAWRKQCAKEVEVEVQLEENFETPGSRVTVENLTLSLPLNYGGMMLKNAGDWWMPMGQTKGLNRLRQ